MAGVLAVLALVAVEVAEPPPLPQAAPGAPSEQSELERTSTPAGSPEATHSPPDPAAYVEDEWHSEARAKVVRSCEAALGPGECSASRDDAEFLTIVSFGSDAVEVSLAHDDARVVRRLPFSPVDGVDQRLVAAGLLVAAMTASEHLNTREEEPPKAPPTAPPPPPPPPVVRLTRLTLDGGVRFEPLLDWDRPAIGAELVSTYWVHRRMGVLVGGEALHSLGSDPRGRTLGGGIGIAFRLSQPTNKVVWLLRGAGRLETVLVDRVTGSSDTKSASRGGGALSLLVTGHQKRGASPLVPYVGFHGTLLGPPLEVQLNGARLLAVPVFRAGLSAGICWKL